MADLGNLFFSLGLDTKQIDSAWRAAMTKYGQSTPVKIRVDFSQVDELTRRLRVAARILSQAGMSGGGASATQAALNAIRIQEREALMLERIRLAQQRVTNAQNNATTAIHRTNTALTTQNRLMQNLNTMAASYISIFAAGRLLSNLVQISGEFETQKVSLQAILRDLDGANAIFDQIKKLAVKSPFQFKDLISYTKQLSAFSIPMNELYDTTKMLADVSAGLGVGMDRLVLAYGQIRAASVLRGQEVRQLTEAGIPVIEALRKKFEELGETGITAADVFDKISARLVPFSMIKDMFTDMTSEGGMFFKMQEIKAETLQGKISNLKDAYQIMFAEIGEKGDAVLKGSVDAVRYLMSNYEAVGKILATLIATYGIYKTSLIVTAIANNALVVSNGLLGASFLAVQGALTTLTAAMAANPYMALALAVTTVVGTMWALSDSSTAAEKAQRNLAATLKTVEETKNNMSKDVSGLIGIITGETSSVYAQVKAWDELIKRYVFFSKYSIDDLRKMTAEQRSALISSFTEGESKKQVQALYESKKAGITELEKSLVSAGKMRFAAGWGVGDKMVSYISKNLQVAREEAQLLAVQLQEIDRLEKSTEFQGKTETERKRLLNLRKESLEAQKSEVEANVAEGKSKDMLIKAIDKQISATTDAIAKFREGEVRQNKEFWEEQKKNAEMVIEGFEAGTLKLMRAGSFTGIKPELVTAYKKAVSDVAQANKMLGIYDFKGNKGDKKQAEEIEKAKEKLTKLEVDLQEKVAAAKVAAMEDGYEKEEAQRTLEHENRIADIKKRANELLEAQKAAGGSGTALSPTNQAVIGSLVGLENTRYATEQDGLYKKLLSKYQDYTDKRKAIEQSYSEDVMQLVLQMNGKNTEEIGKALKIAADKNKKALSELTEEEMNEVMKSSPLLIRIFSDAANMGQKRLKETILLTKQLLAYISGAKGAVLPEGIKPEDAKKMVGDVGDINRAMSQLHKLEEESRKRVDYPLSGFVYGFKKFKEAADLAKASIKGFTEEQKQSRKDEIDAARVEGIKQMGMGLSSLGGILDSVSDAMTRIGEASKNMKLKESAEQIKGVANVMKSAGEGAKSGSWIGAVIGAATSMITQTVEAFAVAKEEDAEYKQNQIDWLNAYQNTLLQIKNEDYESIFGVKTMERSQQAIKNATEALRIYNEQLSKRTPAEYEKEYVAQGAAMFFGSAQGSLKKLTAESKLAVAAYEKGYTDIQRMAIKIKDQSGWANFFGKQDKYKTLFDIAPELWNNDQNGEFNVVAAKAFLEVNTQISAEQRKQIENLIKQKELYDENINIIKEDIKDTWGALGDSLTDSIISAITTGADAFDIFEDAGAAAIEKLGEKLMYEIFFADKFKKLSEDLTNTYKNPENKTSEDIANDQMRIVDDFYKNIGTDMETAANWGRMWKNKAAASGFDVWTNKEATSANLGSSIQAMQMTENTANLIGSYVNAIRADSASRTATLTKMLPVVANINDTMGNGLAHLAMISSNTMRSANNSDVIVEKLNALTLSGGNTKLNVTMKVG